MASPARRARPYGPFRTIDDVELAIRAPTELEAACYLEMKPRQQPLPGGLTLH